MSFRIYHSALCAAQRSFQFGTETGLKFKVCVRSSKQIEMHMLHHADFPNSNKNRSDSKETITLDTKQKTTPTHLATYTCESRHRLTAADSGLMHTCSSVECQSSLEYSSRQSCSVRAECERTPRLRKPKFTVICFRLVSLPLLLSSGLHLWGGKKII